MSNNIFTNVSALNALRNLNNANEGFGESVARLSSGSRIQKAGDDPSGVARSAQLEVNLRDQHIIERNALDARSLLQVSEGGLNEINNLLMRLRELSVAGTSDIAGPEERAALQIEADGLRDEIERIAQTTYYGKHFLLNGSSSDISFQVGIGNEEHNKIIYPASTINVTAGSLGVDSPDMSDPDASLGTLESIEAALSTLQGARAQSGAYQNRLNSVVNLAQKTSEVISGDLSRVRDTDYASESSEFVKRQIQQRAAIAVLAQANMEPQNVLRLLQPISAY